MSKPIKVSCADELPTEVIPVAEFLLESVEKLLGYQTENGRIFYNRGKAEILFISPSNETVYFSLSLSDYFANDFFLFRESILVFFLPTGQLIGNLVAWAKA